MKRKCKEQITYKDRTFKIWGSSNWKKEQNYIALIMFFKENRESWPRITQMEVLLHVWMNELLNIWVAEYYAVKLTGETKKRFIIEK